MLKLHVKIKLLNIICVHIIPKHINVILITRINLKDKYIILKNDILDIITDKTIFSMCEIKNKIFHLIFENDSWVLYYLIKTNYQDIFISCK